MYAHIRYLACNWLHLHIYLSGCYIAVMQTLVASVHHQLTVIVVIVAVVYHGAGM